MYFGPNTAESPWRLSQDTHQSTVIFHSRGIFEVTFIHKTHQLLGLRGEAKFQFAGQFMTSHNCVNTYYIQTNPL